MYAPDASHERSDSTAELAKSLLRLGALGVAVVGALAAPSACAQASARAATTLRCESTGFRDNYCPVETGGGVRLLRQISRAPCRQGASWGYDRHGIWVAEGCVGDFEVQASADRRGERAPRTYAPNATTPRGAQIVCESREYRYHYCPVRVTHEAELTEQLSTSNCRYKRSWGYDRGGVWVDQGCSAVFVVR